MNPASASPHQPGNRRPAALAACAVLAVILNAGAIGFAATASATWHGVSVPTNENAHRGAMVLISTSDASAVPVDSPGPAPRKADLGAPPRRQAASLPVAHTSPEATRGQPQQVVFYTFLEVDTPAFPESDWNLDVESLDAIGVERLAFEVLVNDRGEVVGCTVLAPSDLTDDVKRALEQRLSATRLMPAQRAGQLVASVRRIELLVAAAPLDAPLDVSAHRP